MSANQHIEWLNLVEKTGPFLAVGVLDQAFPQGLEKVETRRRQRVRGAYDEWRDAVDADDPQRMELHREWVKLVLEELLEYDSSVLKTRDALSAALTYREPSCGVEVRPDIAAMAGEKPRLFVAVYVPDTDLNTPVAGDAWAASPIERMIQLCRATGVRLGLATDGENWSVVCVPADGSSSVATWFARIWQQEPVTLQAFVSLLGVRRCFGPAEGTLEALLERSAANQNEVTDTLGEQVRRAVEVLVQALDKADEARNRQLLQGVGEAQLYEAGLTVMMRLVVVLCAEQRGLLLLGADTYDQHYAITTLRARLVKEQTDLTDEVQERRHDAWSRILAVCRGVFGGIEHALLRLPPLGGSLFDPDRFPFLEGRPVGTSWRTTPAVPLSIDNRTVLTLLTALQVLEQAAGAQLLSYEALDVEQVGHVYEGLLERTVKRVPEVTLSLIGSAKAYNPNVPLRELKEKSIEGHESLLSFLQEVTGRSVSALRKALDKPANEALRHRVAVACGLETELVSHLMPFAGLIREDSSKRLLVYSKGSFIVTLGDSRRATGTHYTPKSLTEPIVQHTLEPLVYVGPEEGRLQAEWRLKSPADLLALKICDMAMGSAAFLVQACRWLADRLVEAWDAAEKAGHSISTEGVVLERAGSTELLPRDKAERVLIARRLVASRCLYGVDKNPMAVDLAKVSLWLVTMMKGRPFSFLDHALKCGDSLLGVSSLQQIENFSLRSGERQVTFATSNLFRYVEAAESKRRELEDLPSNDYINIEAKNRLNVDAETAVAKVKAIADCLIALELRRLDGDVYETTRETESETVQRLLKLDADMALESPLSGSQSVLRAHAKEQLRGRRPFHWPVEFSEVFASGGFNAFVGNPPFLGGKRISATFGDEYAEFLSRAYSPATRNVDLCGYFHTLSCALLATPGYYGLISTERILIGDSKTYCLDALANRHGRFYRIVESMPWPGEASVTIAILHFEKNGGASTVSGEETEQLLALEANAARSFVGCAIQGLGFVLEPAEAVEAKSRGEADVVRLFLTSDDLNNQKGSVPKRQIVFFGGMSLREAGAYPFCLSLVEKRVKPYRDTVKRKAHRDSWWQYGDRRPGLFSAIAKLNEVLVVGLTSKHLAFEFVPANYVYDQTTVVVASASVADFALLTSSVHRHWALKFGANLGGTPRYNPSRCFVPFPFPTNMSELGPIGARYHELRSEIIQSRQEGLTSIYNRFHERGETSADIVRLRTLHIELDRVVAAAYGWSDLDLGHDFCTTKQGKRFTISESVRRSVLDRLLALNHEHYVEEERANSPRKTTKRQMTRSQKPAIPQSHLNLE